MAIQANHGIYTNCYIKAEPSTVQGYINELDEKIHVTYVLAYVFTDSTKNTLITGLPDFELEFDPSVSLYTQVYDYMKTLYPIYSNA